MPTADISVTLHEILEYKGSPLLETEIWSILHQTLLYIQTKLGEGNSGVLHFVITSHSLAFTSSGNVVLIGDRKGNQIDTAVKDKVILFSLGKILIQAAEYGLPNGMPADISDDLEYVLCAMCNEEVEQRPILSQLLKACTKYQEQHFGQKPFYMYTRDLYNAILGSGSEGELSPDSTAIEEYSRHYNSLSKENRPCRSRGKYKYTHHRDHRRSRSHSRSRSRSRSPAKDYDDDRYYRGKNSSTDRYFDGHPMGYPSSMQTETSHTTGRSYHLSDITFSSQQNGDTFKSKHHNIKKQNLKPKSKSFATGEHMGNSAYEKYLRIKERQKKLKVLRRGLIGEDSDEDQPIRMSDHHDHLAADTRSLLSTASYQKGAYSPAIHMQYGSEMALKMGRMESDRESIISSEMSVNDHNAMRSMEHHHEKFMLPPSRQPPPKPQISNGTLPKKSRDYYGPEFVHKASNPIIRIPIPLQGESLKNPNHARRVVVVLLTGQKLEAMCDPSTTGQQLFEAVITHSELPEFFFFGLTYVTDGEHFFIDADTKLHKVAPEGWKEGWKGNLPPLTFTVYLRMKFYPEHLTMFRHSISRHQLYLQLRHDLLEERLLCNEEKTLALSSVSIQAEYGDYDQETMGKNYFIPEHYYCGRIIKRVGMGFIRDNTADAHCKFTGLSHSQAEVEFIKMCQQLPEYGVHFHKLFKNKNDMNSLTWIGITVKCLVVAENHGIQRNIMQQYLWHTIQKISFNKRRFSVQPKPDIGQGKPAKLNFYTNSFRKGRYLLQFATAQHRFQLKMKARETNADLQEFNASDIGFDENETFTPEFLQESFTSDDEVTAHKSDPLPYRLPPPYKTDTSVSLLDLRPTHQVADRLHAASMGDISSALQHNGEIEAYVIEPSCQSLELLESHTNESINSTLLHRFDNELLSPEKHDSRIFEVVLEKEPQYGIGITIVGGETPGKMDLGIFVKTVLPGGPAERDGRVRPGDRLIAINDQRIDEMQQAVQLIREAENFVKLCLTHIKPPGSVRRRNSDDVIPYRLKTSMADPSDILIYQENFHRLNASDGESGGSVEDVNNIPHTDVHIADVSTMSQIESIKSEIVEAELPKHSVPNNTVNEDADSEPDSDFDQAIESVDKESPSNQHVSQIVQQENPQFVEDESPPAQNPQFMEDEVQPIQVQVVESQPAPEPEVKTEERGSSLETYEISLTKKDGGFGLNVTGGINTTVRHGGIYVKSLVPGGAAELDGTIHKGDRILEINGKTLVGVTHRQAVEIIKEATETSLLVMEHGYCLSSRSSIRSSRSSQGSAGQSCPGTAPPSPLATGQQSPGSTGLPSPGPIVLPSSVPADQSSTKLIGQLSSMPTVLPSPGSTDQRFIDLKKQTSQDLTAQSGQSHSDETSPSGKDDLDLSAVNTASSDLQSSSIYADDEATSGTCTENSSSTSKPYPFVTDDNTLEVDLVKGSSGLGFSVLGVNDVPANDPSLGLPRIKKIFPLGAAVDSGKLEVGDVILEVNGKPVKDMSHTNNEPAPVSAPPKSILKSANSNQYETESEDEPILYRDSVYTPPTGFTSDSSVIEEHQPEVSNPPQLPNSPIPTLLQSGQFESEDEDLNSTLSSCYPEFEEKNMYRYSTYQNLVIGSPFRTSSSQSYDSTIDNDNLSDGSELEDIENRLRNIKTSDCSQEQLDNDESHFNAIQHNVMPAEDVETDRPGSSYSEGSCSSNDSVIVSPRKELLRTQSQTEGDDGDISSNIEQEELLSPRPNEMDVTLQRNDEEGLGLILTGGISKGGCYIKKIIAGPALSDGRLQPGDKLIKVNGVDMTMLNHFEAVTYLQKAPSIVTIRVFRDPESQKSVNIEDIESDEDLSQGEEEQVITDQESDPDTESVEASTGHMTEENVMSSDQSPLTTSQFSHTSSVTSDSLHIEKIDSCINDLKNTLSELDNYEQSEMNYKIQHKDSANSYPPGKKHGLKSQESEEVDSFGMSLSETGLIKIELEKPPSGELGFGLVTAEKDQQTGIFVRTITHGGVADRDGRLQIMDRIVQINDESLVGLTHKKAVSMLHNIKGKVILTISRLSARQLDLMTPPVIMDDEYYEHESSSSRVKGQVQDHVNTNPEDDQYIEVIEDVTDSEEEDMNELVLAAEKVLADTSELDTEDIVPKMNVHSDENNDGLEGTLTSLTSLTENEELHTRTFNMSSLPRKLDMKVPGEVSFEWLCSCVPLMSLKNDLKSSVSEVARILQHKLDQGDPAEEYKELRQVKMTDNCNVAKQSENKLSNRYRNVLPYDFNRVCLTGQDDYINASHISAPVGEEECHYIACQGPLPQTCEQFWQMIWEQDISVIMMLTLDVEGRKVKCHRYWPDSTETPLFVCDSQLKVSLVECQTLEHFDVKEIEIQKVTSGESKRTYHLNYTTWPDHGVPGSPVPILQFLQLGHVYHTSGPLVVHCSAGIGRTGALITIDIALARLECEGMCDIFEIVKDLRRQRQGMIQTKDQYTLCYEACIAAILSAVE